MEPVTSESATVARRLLLLVGLAYLFLAALASGLAYTGYFTTEPGNGDSGDNRDEEDSPEAALPPRPPSPRPPSRHPDAPGLHTRPDGSRYLVMPLPSDVADRLHGSAHAIGGGVL